MLRPTDYVARTAIAAAIGVSRQYLSQVEMPEPLTIWGVGGKYTYGWRVDEIETWCQDNLGRSPDWSKVK